MKYLKVGCFRSEDELQPTVLDTLKGFLLEPNKTDGSRTKFIGDMPIILRHIESLGTGDAYLMDFARVRVVKVLPLCDLQGNEDEITFAETDMRPSDRASAVLDLPTRCLLSQENGSGVSHSIIGKYLRLLVDDNPNVRFSLVMDGAAQARMEKSKGFTRLTIGLAKLGNVDDLASYGFSEHEIMRIGAGLDASRMNISFGIERGKEESLNVSQVIDLASSLMALPKKYLRSLSAVPTESEVEAKEDELAIDMVKDRIIVKHPITEQESEDLRDAVRYRAVTTAWRKYRELLRERYCP